MMKDMGAYHHVTKVKDMLDADRLLTVRPMSEDIDISTFTAHKNNMK